MTIRCTNSTRYSHLRKFREFPTTLFNEYDPFILGFLYNIGDVQVTLCSLTGGTQVTFTVSSATGTAMIPAPTGSMNSLSARNGR